MACPGLWTNRPRVALLGTAKTLPDHRGDREEFVRQLLADAGIGKPVRDPARVVIFKCEPSDRAKTSPQQCSCTFGEPRTTT
jgi:hypothetical protein